MYEARAATAFTEGSLTAARVAENSKIKKKRVTGNKGNRCRFRSEITEA
jgi:hypothetical protein